MVYKTQPRYIPFLSYTGGLTATGTALQYVRNSLIFNSAAGARSGAKKVVFVLTDGRSNRGVSPGIPARQLKRAGVIIFALGVTNRIRNRELLEIATSKRHVFHVANYATLYQVTKAIQGGKERSQILIDHMSACRFLKCSLRTNLTRQSFTTEDWLP